MSVHRQCIDQFVNFLFYSSISYLKNPEFENALYLDFLLCFLNYKGVRFFLWGECFN